MKDKIQPIMDWASEDKDNRAVIIIGYEKVKQEGNTISANLQYGLQGNGRNLIEALKNSLPLEDKRLAKLIHRAVRENTVEEALKALSNLFKDESEDETD